MRPRYLAWLVAAAAGLMLGAAGVFYGWGDSGEPMSVRQLTFRNGSIAGGRFTADGQVVVYGAAWDDEPYRIYTTRLDSYQSRPLDVPPASLLSLSDDGTLALLMGRMPGTGFEPPGRLARVDLGGGAPRVLTDSVTGADWGPDGVLAVVRQSGAVAELEFPQGMAAHRAAIIVRPRVSPDGDEVCFAADWTHLMLADRNASSRTLAQPLPRVAGCVFSPDGEEIWYSYAPAAATHSNIEAIRRDGSGRRVLASLPSYARIEDVASNGGILVSAGTLRYSVHGARSPDGRELDLTAFDASRLEFLTASGDTVVLADNSAGARESGMLFVRPIDGGQPVQLGEWNALALTPDGRWLATLGAEPADVRASNIVTLLPINAGEPRRLDLPVTAEYRPGNNYGTNDVRLKYPDFSLDGRRLLLPFAREGDAEPRAYVHHLDEGWTRPVTPPGVTGPVVLSPDGRFVASNEAEGLFVYAVDSDQRREVPGGRDPGLLARWSFDDEYVFLTEPSAAGARVFRRSLETGVREFMREITVPDPAGVSRFDLWLARDGEAYAYTLDRLTTNLFVLRNVN